MQSLIIAILASLVIFLLCYSYYLTDQLFSWVRELQKTDRMLLGHIEAVMKREKEMARLLETVLQVFAHQPTKDSKNGGGDNAENGV